MIHVAIGRIGEGIVRVEFYISTTNLVYTQIKQTKQWPYKPLQHAHNGPVIAENEHSTTGNYEEKNNEI